MSRKAYGFTLVELLIVIVVIAILAAITIVAYNGIQQQARNSATAQAANTYLKAFSLYVTQNGNYPDVVAGLPSSNNYCLGVAIGARCDMSSYWSENAALDAQLKTVISNLPAPAGSPATFATWDPAIGYIPYQGGTTLPTLNGVNSAFFIYILDGTVSCPTGSPVSGTWSGGFSSTPPATGATIQQTTSKGPVSECWIPLPQPN